MALYALADMTPNDDNLFPIINLEDRRSAPPPLNGFRWLAESEFAPGAQVGIGRFWTGTLPAEFVDKSEPEVPVDGPTTVEEAWALVEQQKASLAEAERQLARILGVG